MVATEEPLLEEDLTPVNQFLNIYNLTRENKIVTTLSDEPHSRTPNKSKLWYTFRPLPLKTQTHEKDLSSSLVKPTSNVITYKLGTTPLKQSDTYQTYD